MIVYACTDLIFATKIGSTAESLGVPARPARTTQMLRARLDQEEDGKINKPVSAVFVDLELGELAFDLIRCAAEHDAQPKVLAFGPHVMTDTLAGAERLGAEAWARGAFVGRLPELIAQHG